MFLATGNFLSKSKCQLFSAPFDVRLLSSKKSKSDKSITTVVQPDLCVICDPSKIDERGCLGAPDWIIEILSPRNSSKDLREKFDVYEKSGVKEYWVVYPNDQTVMVYMLNEKRKYEGILRPYVRADKISPATLPELKIDLTKVFPEKDY